MSLGDIRRLIVYGSYLTGFCVATLSHAKPQDIISVVTILAVLWIVFHFMDAGRAKA